MAKHNTTDGLEAVATSAIAATTKTPFKTAFMITLGIGAAHLVGFLAAGSIFALVIKLLFF